MKESGLPPKSNAPALRKISSKSIHKFWRYYFTRNDYIHTDRQTDTTTQALSHASARRVADNKQNRTRIRDGKEPSLLGFGSVRVLPNLMVQFGSDSLQLRKIRVRFGFGSDVLCLQFCSVRFYVGSKNV